MASLSSVFHFYAFFLLSLLAISPCSHVHGAEVVSHHVVNVASVLPQDVCSPSTDSDHSRLKVMHRYGPCSPIKHPHKPTRIQILNQDQIHVDWLRRKVSAASKHSQTPTSPISASQIPVNTGDSFNVGNYIATIGLGTPALQQSVVIDTGSDTTWVQCKPCAVSCYPQKQPFFDPSQSSTYRNITCSSPSCTALQSRRCSSPGNNCIYRIVYGDQSYTVGLYAQDTLTLAPSNVVNNFQFGCGQNNGGLFGQSAGLLGLGREPSSMVSQTMQQYGGVFSYCLPPTSSSIGYLTFGSRSTSSNMQFTPMLSDANSPSFYFLELVAMYVGGRQLSIPPTIFSNTEEIIDSGTVITRLPPSAYSVLRSAFRQLMSNYTTAPPTSLLDTCYDFSGMSRVVIPGVALQFQGAIVNLPFPAIMYSEGGARFCLGFAANPADTDLVIIGNTQQRSFNVVYDLSRKVIGFGPGGC